MGREIPIVVLASGRGPNFESIQNAIHLGQLSARILAVISDNPDAPVLAKAKAFGIPGVPVLSPLNQPFQSPAERRLAHERSVLEVVRKFDPHFLVLAGYRRILTPFLIESFRCEGGYSRMVNIHPSLLPSFPGLNSYRQAFRYGVQVTGVTVHLVESEVDGGPICAQEAFSIVESRNEKEVEERGLRTEHRLYPEALSWILPERFTLERREGGRFYVCKN